MTEDEHGEGLGDNPQRYTPIPNETAKVVPQIALFMNMGGRGRVGGVYRPHHLCVWVICLRGYGVTT